MKPVAVFQHCATVRPGHFASFLDARSIPWRLIDVGAGDPVPSDAQAYAGLCFMGGPMSVNDPLPWVAQELALIRDAMARDIPVIGHCLGGQLMAKALGGMVTRNPVKEIGWGKVRPTDTPQTRAWLGDTTAFHTYQWHGETFSLPEGATRILEGRWCTNQAYVLGKHLGMQFHIEMTEELIREWNREWADEFAPGNALPPSVQTPAQQFAQLPAALPAMRAVAEQLYAKWMAGLAAD